MWCALGLLLWCCPGAGLAFGRRCWTPARLPPGRCDVHRVHCLPLAGSAVTCSKLDLNDKEDTVGRSSNAVIQGCR